MNSYVLVSIVLVVTLGAIIASPVDKNKPLDCPEKEKYYKCTLQVCYKKCVHLLQPPPCPLIAASCYKPGCECEDGYLRDSSGTCVNYDECRRQLS